MKLPASDKHGISEYRRKRNFKATPEPPPRLAGKKQSAAAMFVIQKHDATRLHYDFRLEMEGVLKSWAVPKGLPLKKGERHLAVHVEDHPIDYAQFEGTIPEGNYGAGTVMLWDTGTYSVYSVAPLKALAEGKIHLELKGKKLKGEFTLVRLKPRAGESKDNWLIFKTGDDHKPLAAQADDKSIVSGRSMKKIASDNDAQWESNRPEINATKKGAAKPQKQVRATSPKVPAGAARFVEPMKCKVADQPPTGRQWIYEVKFDGFRVIAVKKGKDVELFSRSQKSLTSRFPETVEVIRKLSAASVVLDGEVVALDEEGRSSFQLLQASEFPGDRAPICFYAFDLIHLDGKDLKSLALVERKQLLKQLVESGSDALRYSSEMPGDPVQFLTEVKKRGLEGIIAKDATSLYEPGMRSGHWTKIKCVSSQEFVIGGFTEPQGARSHFGALLVGFFEKGKLRFCSKVGTGFNERLLGDLFKRFRPIARDTCPFVNLPEAKSGRWSPGITAAEMRKCRWVDPKMVCQVRFTEWTRDGHLRHPVFEGIREDKKPAEVVRELSPNASENVVR